ncbi:hypothetical protein [Caballeronia calidae]|nr:hypothetical protein [Caballeronia calidae]
MESWERREQTVPEALKYFYDVRPFAHMLEDRRISTFVEGMIADGNAPPTAYNYGTMCLLAVYLPDRVLEVLDPDHVPEDNWWDWSNSREEARLKILDARMDRDAIWQVLTEFCMQHRADFIERDISELRSAIDKMLTDPQYLSVATAILKTNHRERLENARLRGREDVRIGIPSIDAADIPGEMFNTRSRDAISLDLYQKAVRYADYADARVQEEFSKLSFQGVLATRGTSGLIITVAACLGIFILLAFEVIPSAFAADSSSAVGSKTPFVPPLGLPLSVWVVMVAGFYLLLVVMVVVSIHAGYFAEKKNIKAAAFADGFGKLALGIFLGKISGI